MRTPSVFEAAGPVADPALSDATRPACPRPRSPLSLLRGRATARRLRPLPGGGAPRGRSKRSRSPDAAPARDTAGVAAAAADTTGGVAALRSSGVAGPGCSRAAAPRGADVAQRRPAGVSLQYAGSVARGLSWGPTRPRCRAGRRARGRGCGRGREAGKACSTISEYWLLAAVRRMRPPERREAASERRSLEAPLVSAAALRYATMTAVWCCGHGACFSAPCSDLGLAVARGGGDGAGAVPGLPRV